MVPGYRSGIKPDFSGNDSVATTQPRQACTGRDWGGWGESKILGPRPVLERRRVGETRRQGLGNPTARAEAWRARAPGRACAGPRRGSPALSRPDLGAGVSASERRLSACFANSDPIVSGTCFTGPGHSPRLTTLSAVKNRSCPARSCQGALEQWYLM